MNHEGEPNPATSDLAPDRPWRRNHELVASIRADWSGGRVDTGATTELLATLRTGSANDACDHVVRLLNQGTGPQSVWDAIFTGAVELLMRQPGIVALHAVTTSNALHYAFVAAGTDQTRRMLLLQAAAFLPLFRHAMQGRGTVANLRVDQVSPVAMEAKKENAVGDVLATVSTNREQAAGKVLALLKSEPAEPLIRAARRLVILKANNVHDYKFGSAVLEDYYHISPGWRDRYLAGAMFNLRGSKGPDNPLVERTRAALAS